MIRQATIGDAPRIADIYNHYVEHTVITFDTEPVTAGWMGRQIGEREGAYPWLVYEYQDGITAYACASAWGKRPAYRPSVELSIYADTGFSGRGHGIRLYRELISMLRAQGFHAVMAGIALPNDASVRLHESFGFEKVAHFREVGYKFGRWIDVGYWQLLFEDQSPEPGSSGSE